MESLLGGVVLAALIFAAHWFGLGLAATGFICLTALVLLSLNGSLTSSVILSVAVVAVLANTFSTPIVFDLKTYITRDVALAIAFPVTTLVVTWLVRDVRKRAAALKESERHWREIFEQNPTMYFLIDAHGTVLSINAFGASQLGYEVGELVGQPAIDVIHEADRELVQGNLALCAHTPGQPRAWEARNIRKDGSVVWVRENARFVQWGANDPIFLVSCEDITERRGAEEAVRRSQHNLLEAQRLGHIGSWSVDVSSGANGAMSASPEMLRIFGLDPEKDALTQDLVVERVHPDDRAFIDALRKNRLSAHADFEYDYRIVLPDGAIRRLHSISHPVIGDDGALLEHVGTTMDVTERKEAEEAVRRSEAYLQEAQRLGNIGSWAYDLSTEVMTASPEMIRIFGRDPKHDRLTVTLTQESVHPDDRAFTDQVVQHGARSTSPLRVRTPHRSPGRNDKARPQRVAPSIRRGRSARRVHRHSDGRDGA